VSGAERQQIELQWHVSPTPNMLLNVGSATSKSRDQRSSVPQNPALNIHIHTPVMMYYGGPNGLFLSWKCNVMPVFSSEK